MKNDKKGKLILSIFSFGQRNINKSNVFQKINWVIYKMLNAIFVIGIFNTEIKASKTISTNIYFFHPYGIVINPLSIIKKNVVIRQQVTIGNKGVDNDGCPRIDENVEIGAEAKIIGNIHIGANSKIGANAVVTKSFPENSVIGWCTSKEYKNRY